MISLFLHHNDECINSPSRMEPTRSLIWRVNKNHTNVLTPFCHVYSLMKHTWMLKWQVCQPNDEYVAWAYGCISPTSLMTMCRASLKWQPLQYQCVLWLCFWPTSFIIMFHILVSSFPSSAQRCCRLEPKFMLERFWRHVLQVKVRRFLR
jgi:hypothetical protein